MASEFGKAASVPVVAGSLTDRPCGQWVLLAVQERLRIPEGIVKASAGLGEGRSGGCGVLAGALLALAHCLGESEKDRPASLPANDWLEVPVPSRMGPLDACSGELSTWFEREAAARFGSLECSAISGADWASSPATQRLHYRVENCKSLLAGTVSKLLEIVERERAVA